MSGIRERIKQNAQLLVGKPYVWGGESDGEGGYDCSGFVYRVLNYSGIRIGRTTAQGYYRYFSTRPKYGVRYAKTGDLIFFGKSASKITHVAIVRDFNTMYESIGSSKNTKKKPGKGVVISPIDRRNDVVAVISIVDDERLYYPQYTGKSYRIDTVFCEIGAPYGNVTKRKPVAMVNNIDNYRGTASQNLTLVKLAKQGKLYRL